MTIPTLKALLVQVLSEIFAAEVQLGKTLPKIVSETTFVPLKEMLKEWEHTTDERIGSLKHVPIVLKHGIEALAGNQAYDLRCLKALGAESPAMIKDFHLAIVLNSLIHERIAWYGNAYQLSLLVEDDSAINTLWRLHNSATALNYDLGGIMNMFQAERARQSLSVAEVDSR